jgi:hypothetical protein
LAAGDIPQASSDLREVGTGILVEVATGKVIEKGAGILGRGLGALGAALGLGVRGGLSRKIVGTIGLEHSFDEHAAQWFGRQVTKSTHLKAWQELIERVSRSTQVFDWKTGSAPTVAHLARIDGKNFVVQFFKEGPRAGELATAFVPSQAQIAQMLRLLGQ